MKISVALRGRRLSCGDLRRHRLHGLGRPSHDNQSGRRLETAGVRSRRYKSQQGLTAAVQQDSLVVSWLGEQRADLRMRLGIDDGQPVVRELAVRRSGGQWATLGRNLKPEIEVVSGKRRANNEWGQLRQLKKDTPEEMEGMKWNAFWDAPLEVPGLAQNDGRRGPSEGRGGPGGCGPWREERAKAGGGAACRLGCRGSSRRSGRLARRITRTAARS